MAGIDNRELCGSCRERYSAEVREPVCILCGHSFCRPCLVNLQQVYGEIQCPVCNRLHAGRRAEDLPTNFALLGIVREISHRREEPTTSEVTDDIDKKEYYKDSDTSSETDSDDEDLKKEKAEKEKGKKKINIDPKLKTKDDISSNPEADPEKTCPENDRTNLILDLHPPEKKAPGKRCHPSTVKKIWLWLIVIAVSVFGGLLNLYVIYPSLLASWGFGKSGPVKNTYATRLMSETAKANNGTIPKDSWASWYQAAGTKGVDSDTSLLLFFAGFVIFFILAVFVCSMWYCYNHCKDTVIEAYEKGKTLQTPEVPLTQATNSPT